MKILRTLFALAAAASLSSLTACTSSETPNGVEAAASKIAIVATTGMITDMAAAVAGDRAEVQGLLGAGIDPHLYKPTRSDIAILNSADVVFYNGLLLEGKMTDALIRVATAGKKVYPVTELLDKSSLLEPEAFAGHYDPHVWMDPKTWSEAVPVVRDSLSRFEPQGANAYHASAAEYQATLLKLDAYAERVLSTVPQASRVLVTAHDAFNYFGRRYGYEVVGIQGISTESEAGVKDLERIVDILVDRNIRAVFVETTVSDRNVTALLEGANARGHEVRIGGKLFSDAMGPPNTYEGTYVGMIDHNVTTIARALGGSAPVGGMQNRLTARAAGENDLSKALPGAAPASSESEGAQ